MYVGVVLAAGASVRFGSPKALVPVQGEPAVARAARLMEANGCQRVAVVLGSDAERVRKAVPRSAAVVVNEQWEAGRTGSLKVGLRAVVASAHVVVWPVDHPAVAGATVRALVDASGVIRIPRHEGHRGHPILFESSLRDEVLALADDEPLHDVVHARPDRVVDVPVNDAGIHLNLDTPADLKRLDAHFGGPARARPLA